MLRMRGATPHHPHTSLCYRPFYNYGPVKSHLTTGEIKGCRLQSYILLEAVPTPVKVSVRLRLILWLPNNRNRGFEHDGLKIMARNMEKDCTEQPLRVSCTRRVIMKERR
jgi:hypothetical protein